MRSRPIADPHETVDPMAPVTGILSAAKTSTKTVGVGVRGTAVGVGGVAVAVGVGGVEVAVGVRVGVGGVAVAVGVRVGVAAASMVTGALPVRAQLSPSK